MADAENRTSKQSGKPYSPVFKAKAALEAIREVDTVAELAAKCQTHPSPIHTWRRQLTEAATEIFEKGTKKDEPEPDVDNQELYRQTGRSSWRKIFYHKGLVCRSDSAGIKTVY